MNPAIIEAFVSTGPAYHEGCADVLLQLQAQSGQGVRLIDCDALGRAVDFGSETAVSPLPSGVAS